ncbi:MAG: hypothetical protein R3C68_18680 [Myxococcota bacterium]
MLSNLTIQVVDGIPKQVGCVQQMAQEHKLWAQSNKTLFTNDASQGKRPSLTLTSAQASTGMEGI